MLRRLALTLWLVFATHAAAQAADLDRDGLDDALEDQLLARFVPVFLISGGECDVAPAEFAPGLAQPKVVARNGTIYGQVFPHSPGRLELHYYHLWGRDCGTKSHPLDAEHVSALLDSTPAEPRALAWYAAAHEDTVCDAGSAAKATVLDAEFHGPRVWISKGKHGSFLSALACHHGCGGDKCEGAHPLANPRVINLGEAGNPLNGSAWALSPAWPLRAKMQPDFDPVLLAKIETRNDVVDLRGLRRPAQEMIAGGNRAVSEVGGAEKRAEDQTGKALGKSASEVGKAVSGSKKTVSGWLRKHL